MTLEEEAEEYVKYYRKTNLKEYMIETIKEAYVIGYKTGQYKESIKLKEIHDRKRIQDEF